MRRVAILAVFCIPLVGCSYNVALMPRDSGKAYAGSIEANGGGSGTMAVVLDGVACSGPVARVGSGQSVALTSAFGVNSRGQTGSALGTTVTSGDTSVKAILSCSDGKGLRCDMTGSGGSAGGVCVDDSGRIFDVLATRK